MKRSMAVNALLFLAIFFVFPIISTGEEQDFRHISYQELQQTFDTFSEPGVISYTQLLFDVGRNQVLVGARDNLYRLSISNLRLLEKTTWKAPEKKTALCLTKGQSEEDCHNFIKVLLTNGRKLFTCGTSSFAPECTWREIENISTVIESVDGIAKCPYNPHANITAVMTESGEYYVGGPTDFSGSDMTIYRSMGLKASTLRTNQYNSKWLNGPQFVGSFETDKFVFFVFREAAVEYINCGKIIYSRIARVCKNDSGGRLILKDNWTTFVKARLNCSISGDYPFYFNEIQGMSYVPGENVVYATFTTPSNSIAGSAICAFNLSAINDAFSGPFKYQEHPGSAWEQHTSPHKHHFECGGSNRSNHLVDSSKYQLMDNAVQSMTLDPIHIAQLERFTHITVDVLATEQHTSVHVIFVATIEGLVKKLTVLQATQTTCVVEIWKPVENSAQSLHSIQFLKDTNSLYIGTEQRLIKIPAQHCKRHASKAACINAMDPYCGWNDIKRVCSPAPNGDPSDRQWIQNINSCPKLNAPIGGGWSTWSPWVQCMQHNSKTPDSLSTCLCQTRQCSNPAPKNGGATCEGVAIAVTNCTIHGEWTAWSPWSACSQTCGVAFKTRRRTCGNPAPAHGGRVCVGHDIDQVFCNGIPGCPAVAPRDGKWSTWDEWSQCSAQCGGGFRKRHRRCDNPAPAGAGLDCVGCNVEYDTCNAHPCEEQKKLGPWTPWMQLANGSHGDEYKERRYRFSCKAPGLSAAHLKIAVAKTEDRMCKSDGQCSRGAGEESAKWTDWTQWNECSVTCGGGEQRRFRICEGRGECNGQSVQLRMCNTHSCTPTWGCWSDWSECSVSCGIGKRQRYRSCLNGDCQGPHTEEESCEAPPCASLLGWENWTVWSVCDENLEQHRKRKCRTSNPGPQLCQGPDTETRMCLGNDLPNDLTPAAVSQASSGAVVVAFACVISFILGIGVTFGWTYWQKRKAPPRIPSSPHYMSSKQNPYITVPLHELPSKRAMASSSNTVLNNTGTLKMYPKTNDYETATIKRNSSLNNGHNRNDSLIDKYY